MTSLPSMDSLMQIPAQTKDATTTQIQIVLERNPCFGSVTFRNPWMLMRKNQYFFLVLLEKAIHLFIVFILV